MPAQGSNGGTPRALGSEALSDKRPWSAIYPSAQTLPRPLLHPPEAPSGRQPLSSGVTHVFSASSRPPAVPTRCRCDGRRLRNGGLLADDILSPQVVWARVARCRCDTRLDARDQRRSRCTNRAASTRGEPAEPPQTIKSGSRWRTQRLRCCRHFGEGAGAGGPCK